MADRDDRVIEHDDRPTRAEIEANEAPTPGGPRRLGEDPWLPWTCPRCGTDHPSGMPEKCDCGWRNFGG